MTILHIPDGQGQLSQYILTEDTYITQQSVTDGMERIGWDLAAQATRIDIGTDVQNIDDHSFKGDFFPYVSTLSIANVENMVNYGGYAFENLGYSTYKEKSLLIETTDFSKTCVPCTRDLYCNQYFILNPQVETRHNVDFSYNEETVTQVSGIFSYNNIPDGYSLNILATTTDGYLPEWTVTEDEAQHKSYDNPLTIPQLTSNITAINANGVQVVEVEIDAFTIPEGGTVTGSGQYIIGQTATLSCQPPAGYAFRYWTPGFHQMSIYDNPVSFEVTQHDGIAAICEYDPTQASRITFNPIGCTIKINGEQKSKYEDVVVPIGSHVVISSEPILPCDYIDQIKVEYGGITYVKTFYGNSIEFDTLSGEYLVESLGYQHANATKLLFRNGVVKDVANLESGDGQYLEEMESSDIVSAYVKPYLFTNGTSIYPQGVVFSNLQSLRDVTIAEGGRFEDDYGIFENCTTLEMLDLQDSVFVRQGYLSGCTRLKTIYANESFLSAVAYYGNEHFTGCGSEISYGEKTIVIPSTGYINDFKMSPLGRLFAFEKEYSVSSEWDYDEYLYFYDGNQVCCYQYGGTHRISYEVLHSKRLVGIGSPYWKTVSFGGGVLSIDDTTFSKHIHGVNNISLQENAAIDLCPIQWSELHFGYGVFAETCLSGLRRPIDMSRVVEMSPGENQHGTFSKTTSVRIKNWNLDTIPRYTFISTDVEFVDGSYAFPNIKSIDKDAFMDGNIVMGGDNILSIDGVTNIADGTFNDMNISAEQMIFKNCLAVGYSAFKNSNTNTRKLVFNNCLTVGDYAFYEMKSNLSSFDFQNCVSIGFRSFENISSEITQMLFGKCKSVGYGAFLGFKSKAQTVDFDNCISVEELAFAGATTNAKLLQFNKCTTVGNSAFSGFSNNGNGDLTIEMPFLRNIGDGAFSWVSSLTNVFHQYEGDVENNMNLFFAEDIGSRAFSHTRLNNVNARFAKRIGANAFEFCKNINAANAPIANQVENYAFWQCTRLEDTWTPVISTDFSTQTKGLYYECNLSDFCSYEQLWIDEDFMRKDIISVQMRYDRIDEVFLTNTGLISYPDSLSVMGKGGKILTIGQIKQGEYDIFESIIDIDPWRHLNVQRESKEIIENMFVYKSDDVLEEFRSYSHDLGLDITGKKHNYFPKMTTTSIYDMEDEMVRNGVLALMANGTEGLGFKETKDLRMKIDLQISADYNRKGTLIGHYDQYGALDSSYAIEFWTDVSSVVFEVTNDMGMTWLSSKIVPNYKYFSNIPHWININLETNNNYMTFDGINLTFTDLYGQDMLPLPARLTKETLSILQPSHDGVKGFRGRLGRITLTLDNTKQYSLRPSHDEEIGGFVDRNNPQSELMRGEYGDYSVHPQR